MYGIYVGALRSVTMEIVSGAIDHNKVHNATPASEGLANQVAAFLTWFNQTRQNTGSRPMDGLVRAASLGCSKDTVTGARLGTT